MRCTQERRRERGRKPSQAVMADDLQLVLDGLFPERNVRQP
jgi:hypothetical protein